MQKVHDMSMVGHCGEEITKVTLNKSLYWPNIEEDVEHYFHTCVKC
jgi:hypothetical protein